MLILKLRGTTRILSKLKAFQFEYKPVLGSFSNRLYSIKLDTDDENDLKKVREFKNIYEIKESLRQKYLAEEKKYNGKLVYVGSLTHQLKAAKILSLSSSLLGILMLPFLTNTLASSALFAKIFVFGTSGFFILVTPILSQVLTRKYVSRMYYNYEEKKFTAILFNFWLFEYKLEFDLNDAFMPEIPGLFTTLKLKSNGRNLFVDLNQISDLSLTEKILGYDKDFNIEKYKTKKD